MQQIYKVFINNFFILIIDESQMQNNSVRFHRVESDVELNNYLLSCEYLLNVNILYTCKCTLSVFESFKTKYQFLSAAGGLVINQKQEVLMIYKNNIWDLPKGKIDAGELAQDAAVREVFEETNVKFLKILSEEYKTYHMYNDTKSSTLPRMILKETKWFFMESKSPHQLIPQLNEGITKVSWVPIKNTKRIATYELIKLLLQTFILD